MARNKRVNWKKEDDALSKMQERHGISDVEWRRCVKMAKMMKTIMRLGCRS